MHVLGRLEEGWPRPEVVLQGTVLDRRQRVATVQRRLGPEVGFNSEDLEGRPPVIVAGRD